MREGGEEMFVLTEKPIEQINDEMPEALSVLKMTHSLLKGSVVHVRKHAVLIEITY